MTGARLRAEMHREYRAALLTAAFLVTICFSAAIAEGCALTRQDVARAVEQAKPGVLEGCKLAEALAADAGTDAAHE